MSALKHRAIKAINARHVLLTFPIKNAEEVPSLWQELHPRSTMNWAWDDNSDSKVHRLWHLREELSQSGQVVYCKWFRNRATFFSLDMFPYFLRLLNSTESNLKLSRQAQELFEILEDNSPIATRELKKLSELKGKENETKYQKAMKELWSRLLIVAWGEKEEGAFPSLQMGSTRLLFPKLWEKAFSLDAETANKKIKTTSSIHNSKFTHFLAKLVLQSP